MTFTRRRTRENVIAAVLLGVFLLFAAGALTYGSRARLVPLAVAVASIALMAVQLLVQNLRSGDKADDGEEPGSPTPDAQDGPVETTDAVGVIHESGGSPLGGLILVAVFVVAIIALGILPAALVYVFAYFRWISRARIWVSVTYAVGTWGALYLLFVVFLGVPMYGGYLGAFAGLLTS